MKQFSVAILVLGGFAFAPAFAEQVQIQKINSDDTLASPADALQGPARKIMRLSDGRIYGSFLIDKEKGVFRFFAAPTLASEWKDATGPEARVAGRVSSVSSDTGPAGSYVSLINDDNDTGEILFFRDPIAAPGKYQRFAALTPAGAKIRDGIVAASKGEEATNSVVYAWRDAEKNQILVGVSVDGRSFGSAKAIVADSYLQSGPTLAVHNNYALVSYLSADPRFAPRPEAAGKAFPVWVESWDSGKSWSEPRAVLGASVGVLPKVDYAVAGVKDKNFRGTLLAGGGASQASNSLAWAQIEIGARIFVLSGQEVVSRDGKLPEDFRHGAPTVGVLAFKDLSDGPGAPWQTVVASAAQASPAGASDFQYSALPGTSIRAVAYKSGEANALGADGIAVSISTNTGKSFDRAAFVSKKALGLSEKEALTFTTSTCVSKNDSGDLFLDVAYAEANRLKSALVPLHVNLKELPPSMFNTLARWP
jgi:hypothetical protein